MRWITIILTVLACLGLVGCVNGRSIDGDYESEEQKLVETIRLARTLDTESTEVEDMIILNVYQLRSEDHYLRADHYDEVKSDISNCAVKDSTGRLKYSSITKRIDTLLDKERFSQFVANSYTRCRAQTLSAQSHRKDSKTKGKNPSGQKKAPFRETPFYELIERHYENEALENTVTPEN